MDYNLLVGIIALVVAAFGTYYAREQVRLIKEARVSPRKRGNTAPVPRFLGLKIYGPIALLVLAAWAPYVMEKRAEVLTPQDLLESYIHDRKIYMIDLARMDTAINGKTFENVTFIGPAVMTLGQGSVMTYSTFDLQLQGTTVEDLFLETPPQKLMRGVIVFHNSSFRHCRFERIQFAGSKVLLDKVRKSFEEGMNKK